MKTMRARDGSAVSVHQSATSSRARTRTATLALFASLFAASPAAAKATALDTTCPVAADAKGEGDRAMLKGKYDVALACYETAYAQDPDPKLLYNRARALEHLSRYADALTLLLQFDREAPSELKDKVPGLAELMRSLSGKVGTILVNTNVPAGIWLDDVHVVDAPMEQPLLVDPGRTELTVRAMGYHDFSVALNIGAGQSKSVDATLEPRASAAPPASAEPRASTGPTPLAPTTAIHEHKIVAPSETAEAPPDDSNIVAYTALGVGGAGLIAALIGYLTANSAHDDVCGGASRCPSNDYDAGALETHHFGRNLNTVGLIVGGAGLAVGAGLLLFDTAKDEGTASDSGWNATLEATGVKLRGRF